MRTWTWPVVGTLLCATTAVCLSVIFEQSSFIKFLPLLTLVIIIWIASRFGATAGILGTIAAAIVFAGWLFTPRFSLRVANHSERSNLIWMVIAGVALSELVGRMPRPPRTLS
jgi:K+-sensing histidine kinase KdpD